MSNVRELRYGIACEILEAMEAAVDLPLPNSQRLAKVMQEYFLKGDYAEELKEAGYKWRPRVEYWSAHMKGIRKELRKDGKFFEYVRLQGEFRGQWKFTDKKEFRNTKIRMASGIGTRTDNYNEQISDASQRWKLDLPPLERVPELPEYNNN